MTPAAVRILELFDAGKTPVQIIAAGQRRDRVYAVLRKERPARARAPRTRTSVVPGLARQLDAEGFSAARIAVLLCVTPQYVYSILKR